MVHPRGTVRGAAASPRLRLKPGHAARGRGCRARRAEVAASRGPGEEFVENAVSRQGARAPAAGSCSGTCQPAGTARLSMRGPVRLRRARQEPDPEPEGTPPGMALEAHGHGLRPTVGGWAQAWVLSGVPWGRLQGSRLPSKLLSNAMLNVAAGASSAAFLILVPVLVSNKVSPQALSAWAVIMQPLAYVAPFTLGIQSVVARNVAMQSARNDPREMHHVVNLATRMMWWAATLYLLLFSCVSLVLPAIYPEIEGRILDSVRVALFLFAAGQFIYIPIAAISGYFLGLQNNVPVAANMVISRFLMGILIVFLASEAAFVSMSGAAALASILSGLMLWFHYVARRRAEFPSFPKAAEPEVDSRKLLLRECLPISIWALASFAIYGGSSTVASILDFPSYGVFTIAVGLSTLVLGLHSAAFSTLIPHVASLSVSGDPASIAGLTQRATFVSTVISALSTWIILLITPFLLGWVTTRIEWKELCSFLLPLLLGNALRLIALPYSNTIVALGLQARILSTPLAEASAVMLGAIVLGSAFGAIGVAWALPIGALISLCIHGLRNIPDLAANIPVKSRGVIFLPAAILILLLAPTFIVFG